MNERLKTYINKKLSKIDEELFIEQIDDELYQIFYSGVDGLYFMLQRAMVFQSQQLHELYVMWKTA